MAIATTDPTTGEVVRTFTALTAEEVEERIAAAVAAFTALKKTDFAQRSGWMQTAAGLLEADVANLSAIMTQEMGKTLAASEAEVRKCATAMRYYAEHAEAFLADKPYDAEAVGARRAFVRYFPLGPVLAVMPWNYPLWQVIRFAAPGLMAGNVGLLKHASNVPQTALYIEELFLRAGFPRGSFQTLLIPARQVESVLRDPRVKAATLTGSEPAGQSVAAIAGDEIKPVVLELGGSDPFIVMPSADLDRAVETAVRSRTQNNGQSCIGAKRFLVHEEVYDAFVDKFVAAMGALVVGDPTDPATDVGPLVSEQGRTDLEALVEDAVGKGAQVLVGGQRLDGPGWFYPPTVLTGVTDQMRLYTEEAFGPVAPVYRISSVEEAIALADVVPFGLGSNVWTEDEAEREAFIAGIDAGAVTINGMTTSYPELPFGGTKRSGLGHELADVGIREFCNAKTVWVGA